MTDKKCPYCGRVGFVKNASLYLHVSISHPDEFYSYKQKLKAAGKIK